MVSYKFSALVVGTGGKIYAALSPMIIGDGNPPYICVINCHGTIEKTIPIADSDHQIYYLTQNSTGEVFFGTSEYATKTSVYRINPKTDAVSEILNHTSPDKGGLDQPIKVDEDDYLYFVIEPQFVANYAIFYCINRSGSVRWSHSFPSQMRFYRSSAAIDEARDQVYLNYYDSSTNQSKLVCFEREFNPSNQVKWTHTFPGTHTASEMAGPPAVAANGTIYVGCFTSIYALSPDDGSELWPRSFHPSYVCGEGKRAVGPDGTLYVAHGKFVNSDWHASFITALDTSDNGALKWEEEVFTPTSSFDNLDEIYVGRNGVLAFSYAHDDPAENRTGALIDQGESANLLWDVGYGGKKAFGSSNAFYVIPYTAEASVYALSIGERGNPDGLAMAYTNNEPPVSPSNPTPPDESQDLGTSVTLSWVCSDPDGHDVKYNVFVGESTSVTVPVATGLTDTSCTVNNLAECTGYIWKVVATDGQAVSEGPTWSFSTWGVMGDELAVDFGTQGLWHYGSSWDRLSSLNCEGVTAWDDGVAVDFGVGLFSYNGTTWKRLSSLDPGGMTEWNNNLAVDFGSGKGLFTYDGASWKRLSSSDCEDLVECGDDLIVDFGTGLFSYNGTTWKRLSSWDPEAMTEWNNNLAVDFGTGKGLFSYNGTTWKRLSSLDPEAITEWGEKLAVDFGFGFFSYAGSSWTKLSSWDAEDMVAWGEDLAVDFGTGKGLFSHDGISWSKLSSLDAEGLAAWRNGLAVDFGTGLFNYDWTSWNRLSTWDAQDIEDVDLLD